MDCDFDDGEGDRFDAEYLILTLEPHSDVAGNAIQGLADLLWKERTRKQAKAFEKALAAFVAGLLRNEARVPKGWSYRKMSSGSFTGEPVGYRGIRDAFDRLAALKLLRRRKGTGGGNEISIATRFQPAPRLVKLLAGWGISPEGWREHFRPLTRPMSIKHPIALKSGSITILGRKWPGRQMPFDEQNSPARELGNQVNELNLFFAGVDIQPADEHHAFHRLFNQGDLPEFEWNKGGRLYSLGGAYQTLSKAARKEITLEGQSVVEIDIRASHLTILHAKLGLPFDPKGADPYSIGDLPREIVKA